MRPTRSLVSARKVEPDHWVKDFPGHEDEKQVAVQQDVQVLRQEVGAARARTTDRGGIDHGVESGRRGNSFSRVRQVIPADIRV